MRQTMRVKCLARLEPIAADGAVQPFWLDAAVGGIGVVFESSLHPEGADKMFLSCGSITEVGFTVGARVPMHAGPDQVTFSMRAALGVPAVDLEGPEALKARSTRLAGRVALGANEQEVRGWLSFFRVWIKGDLFGGGSQTPATTPAALKDRDCKNPQPLRQKASGGEGRPKCCC